MATNNTNNIKRPSVGRLNTARTASLETHPSRSPSPTSLFPSTPRPQASPFFPPIHFHLDPNNFVPLSMQSEEDCSIPNWTQQYLVGRINEQEKKIAELSSMVEKLVVKRSSLNSDATTGNSPAKISESGSSSANPKQVTPAIPNSKQDNEDDDLNDLSSDLCIPETVKEEADIVTPPDHLEAEVGSVTEATSPAAASKAPATELDWTSIGNFNVSELRALCKERGLRKSGLKAELVTRVRRSLTSVAKQENFKSMTKSELKEACIFRNIPTSGNKADLIQRLEKNDVLVQPTKRGVDAFASTPQLKRSRNPDTE